MVIPMPNAIMTVTFLVMSQTWLDGDFQKYAAFTLTYLYTELLFFWVTFCKTVLPMPSDRCPVLSVLSVTLIYCGQTVGWIKMKLHMGLDLGLGHIVLDGHPAPQRKGAQQTPTFEIYGRRLCLHPYNAQPMSIVPNGWMD